MAPSPKLQNYQNIWEVNFYSQNKREIRNNVIVFVLLSGGNMFKCNLCERSFETQRGLNRHYIFCQGRQGSQLSPQDETTINEDQSIPITDNLVRDVPDFIWGEMSTGYP